MKNHKESMRDHFDYYGLSNDTKEAIKEVVSFFHYRDGVKHEDGSMGTIKISPKELRDALSYILGYCDE